MARRKRRSRGLLNRTGDSVSVAMLVTVGLGLFAAVLCLEIIGPPPRWRIDGLWVRGHSRTVRLAMAGGMVALFASLIPFLLPGRGREGSRAMILLLWVGAAVACAMLYWDRLPILYNVVSKHMM